MSYDVAYFRSQISRIIDTAPTLVNTTRTSYEEDGYGGRRIGKESETVHSGLKVLFDNASLPDLDTSVSEAGRKITQPSIRLFVLWEPEVDICRGDEVEVIQANQFYRVTAVNNVLEQNLLLEVKLELRD